MAVGEGKNSYYVPQIYSHLVWHRKIHSKSKFLNKIFFQEHIVFTVPMLNAHIRVEFLTGGGKCLEAGAA